MPEKSSIDNVPGLQKFLDTEPAAVLTVPIDKKGVFHSAGLLFVFDKLNTEFIFITSIDTEKCKLLKIEGRTYGSCVIGVRKGTPYSLQMRGNVVLKKYKDAQTELNIYQSKFNKRTDDISDSGQVVLIFKPSWARCTDYISQDWQDGYKRILLDV